MLFKNNLEKTNVNSIYATFKGGYGSGWPLLYEKYPGKPYRDDWDYFCLWGHLRFCYNASDLIDGWTHIAIHGYRYGYTYTPIKNLLWNFDFHFAYRNKWPFIKIGFNRLWPNLYKERD